MAATAIVNSTGELGIVIQYLTYNITGSLFISLVAIVLVIMGLALAFSIPLEWTMIIVFPIFLAVGAFYSDFFPILGAAIFYMALIIANNWFYR
jgi:hypothetical protein